MHELVSQSVGSESRPCAVIHESVDGAEILHAFGVLDEANVAMFESAIVRSIRIGKAMIVDLRECPGIDASVIAMLARAHRALERQLRLLVAEGTNVHRALTASTLEPHVRVGSAWNS